MSLVTFWLVEKQRKTTKWAEKLIKKMRKGDLTNYVDTIRDGNHAIFTFIDLLPLRGRRVFTFRRVRIEIFVVALKSAKTLKVKIFRLRIIFAYHSRNGSGFTYFDKLEACEESDDKLGSSRCCFVDLNLILARENSSTLFLSLTWLAELHRKCAEYRWLSIQRNVFKHKLRANRKVI